MVFCGFQQLTWEVSILAVRTYKLFNGLRTSFKDVLNKYCIAQDLYHDQNGEDFRARSS